MQRIQAIEVNTAPEKTAELLMAVKQQLGGVPRLLSTLAQSAASLEAYLNFAGAMAGGRLSARLREQIALAVAGANRCDYCASAHTALGSNVGIPEEELANNLNGKSGDAATQAALVFARRVVGTRGNVSNADLDTIRAAGYTEEEIVEIVSNTILNIFTNYFNHVARTEIDFPVVSTSASAVA